MNCRGTIFDIQSFSIHDGPGTRTTVFLKGCPLRCVWCCNPESWNPNKELLFRSQNCKHCYSCAAACEVNALKFNQERITILDKYCASCTSFSCVQSCSNDGLELVGEKISCLDLIAKLLKHQDCWGEDGGVTFSGGEPFFQYDFLLECLKLCDQNYISTAIETSAYCKSEYFLNAMKYVDFIFVDIKHMSIKEHIIGTGISNELILRNIQMLCDSHWSGRLVIRVPIIDGFNNTRLNISSLADFMLTNRIMEVNLLPFHEMGISKWDALRRKYDCSNLNLGKGMSLIDMKCYLEQRGLNCYLGGDIPF
ncbi:MAG: glycyl-radical enzyme activating protein [Bacteroidales bacterium]